MTAPLDEARLGQLMGTMAGHMTGGALCFSVWLGDELGLYRILAEKGSLSSESIAKEAGCHPRLVREWLDGQVAGGLIGHDTEAGTYELSREAIAVLADDSSPVFVARGMNALAAMYFDQAKVAAAFRGDGGLAWGDHHPCLFLGTEWFFRTGYRAYLPTQWIPSLDGMEAKLRNGARVADVGCGHGASAIVMAQAYPDSRIWGFDLHPASVTTAAARAEEAGLSDRVEFAIADSKSYPGEFDLICFFDCLHDMGDPVGIARLRPGAPRRGWNGAPRRALRPRRPINQSARQSDGRPLLYGVHRDLPPQLLVPGGRPRPRRPGRRGALATGVRGGRVYLVPTCLGDADEPDPRSPGLTTAAGAALIVDVHHHRPGPARRGAPSRPRPAVPDVRGPWPRRRLAAARPSSATPVVGKTP